MAPPPTAPATHKSKIAPPGLFGPRRAPSNSSMSSAASKDSLAKAIPAPLLSSNKKYKAPLSTEVRRRPLSYVPGTPTKGSRSRPTTPGVSPRKEDASIWLPSEMDVSNVDPESVLVDFQTVEAADESVELDEAWLRTAQEDHGKDDKVMVSVRVRPSDKESAWIPSVGDGSIKLDRRYAGPTTSTAPFTYDAVLTGSENKPVYATVGRSHVQAAMDGYNAVIFAYGQTASGKTFTLTGDDDEPGIIPRAMKDVFAYIKSTPSKEYLLRCSYLEIYNENIHDLLAPPSIAASNPVQIQGGSGGDIILAPLREEVVTSLKGVRDVLKRGEGNRRTACTDWNDRSSRSHSVFRLVIESRERGTGAEEDDEDDYSPRSTGRQTPGLNGRQTPGLGGRQTPGLGGPRLQARGGRSVTTSVLSLIDLAGSEKATSDKERTREGKYINTSLLTLGTVIGTLADNAAKKKADHVPFRNSKLTRMLQPSLSGNARISVICTINPDASAVAESTSTLLFAKRIKSVKLHAKKKELVDTDALIERYRKEIEDLKARLSEREADAPVRKRRLSARETLDESRVVKDLNARIKQLTKLILTSQSIEDAISRPSSPSKVDFDMSPYQLQQELLAARNQLESQGNQLLSLEAALLARPPLPADAPDSEKDRMINDQAKTIRELENIVRGYEENVNLDAPISAVKEDLEREWKDKLAAEVEQRQAKEKWADELMKELEKEKRLRQKLEGERQALAAFVSKFDQLGLGLGISASVKTPSPFSVSTPSSTSPGTAGSGTRHQKRGVKVSSLSSSSFASHLFSNRSNRQTTMVTQIDSSSTGFSAGEEPRARTPTPATPPTRLAAAGTGIRLPDFAVASLSSPARPSTVFDSPMRITDAALRAQPSLLDQAMPTDAEFRAYLEVSSRRRDLDSDSSSHQRMNRKNFHCADEFELFAPVGDSSDSYIDGDGDVSLSYDDLEIEEHQLLAKSVSALPVPSLNTANRWKAANLGARSRSGSPARIFGPVGDFGDKENVVVTSSRMVR